MYTVLNYLVLMTHKDGIEDFVDQVDDLGEVLFSGLNDLVMELLLLF